MKILFTSCFLMWGLLVVGQIDTSFYMAKYPTGHDGLVRDIEAFANISELDKNSILDTPIEITFLILVDGEIGDIFVRSDMSEDLKSRIEAVKSDLHEFIPARSNEHDIESTYIVTLSYPRDYYYKILSLDKSNYSKADLGWSMDIGGYVGGFAGNINEVYSVNGGMYMGFGIVGSKYIVNVEFGIGGASKVGEFDFPPEVIAESNNAHILYGISLSRIFKFDNGNDFRTKLGVGGYSVNAGFISENNLYRFSGFDVYGEMSYSFKFADIENYNIYNYRMIYHYVAVFSQLHSWLGDDQTKGMFYNVGIRYSFESYAMKRI